jgi:hypothetical protein
MTDTGSDQRKPAGDTDIYGQVAAFDHDAYVRAGLPNFVLAGMGLRPGDPARLRPAAQPAPRAASTPASKPPSAARTRERAAPKAPREPSPDPPPSPPNPPLPPGAVVPANYERHLAMQRAAHRVTRVVTGTPLVIGGLLLVSMLIALIVSGGVSPDHVTVNDEPYADCPVQTLTPAQLRTEHYWEC